jgi:CRP/FNR family transcriptional regulator, polysaccharide utilization system transcription regulator
MKTILLIEDNLEMRENTAEILELAKFKVITASNGKEGVKLAEGKKPDLIICDIMMPELDGYGVLHMLGRDSVTASIPFIFLTAKAEKGDYRKGMGMGADDYLTKPFDDTELLNAVETRLRKNEMLKAEFIRTSDGLNEFMNEASHDHLISLSTSRDAKPYKKKENIYTEGSHPKSIYFVAKGKVKTFKANEDGKEYITGLHKEGDFFGYTSLLEDLPYTDSATTLEESEIVVIPKEDFFSLLYSSRDIASKFIKILSDNVKEKEDRLLKLAYNSVRKRVAEALIMLRNRYKKDGSENFSMAISREDLAGIVGTATETVIRTLSDFKEEKLIDISGSNITVLNSHKLEAMKN